MSDQTREQIAEVLADARCADVHGSHWNAMRRAAPDRVRYCESCRSWADSVSARLAVHVSPETAEEREAGHTAAEWRAAFLKANEAASAREVEIEAQRERIAVAIEAHAETFDVRYLDYAKACHAAAAIARAGGR